MLTLLDKVALVVYVVLALVLILVGAQAIVTMHDISVSLRQTQLQHEQMLKDHQAQMRAVPAR